MREPRYPLPRVVTFSSVGRRPSHRARARAGALAVRVPWRGPRRGLLPQRATPGGWRRAAAGEATSPRVLCVKLVRGSFCWAGFDNDPSAGSPTETLLRLLLPLNDKVQWTSRDVAGGEPPTSPRSEHFTGPFNR